MTVAIVHQKVSAIADDPASVAAGEVVPSDWNATHTVTGFGAGVEDALAVNVGTSGAFIVNGGALGAPSSGTLTNVSGLPISTGISGLGTGVATALAVNTGSSGAIVVNGGALGTPASGTVTNLTGTASININGTVGATTPTTGAFTTLSASSTVSGVGFSNYLASPPAIGGTTPAAGSFTDLVATGISTLGGTGASTITGTEVSVVGTAPTTGGTNSHGIYTNILLPSNTTGTGFGIRSGPGTATASFTIGTLACFGASPGTVGAGSTITAHTGFLAQSGLTQGTNNYGFYGNIAASGSARWNCYMAGTAPNFFQGPVGVGATTTTDIFRIGGTATGATIVNGQIIDATIGSGITSGFRSILSRPITQAASFTLTNLYHFYANPQTKGAGSTITNQYAFQAESTLTDATNNFGFYGNIAAALNRWNFYAAGTAQNYFAGNTFIGATTGDQALNVNGAVRVASATTANQTSAGTTDFTGGAMRFLVWGASGTQGIFTWWTGTGALGATQRMTLDGSNNLGLATSTFGTSATNTFSVFTGTAPTTGPADTVQFYSTDLSAGNTIPSFYTEGTNVGTGTPTANRTIAVRFNGTIYYLLASTIP